jgi:toluene monooxygenase system ferredoxin subunit
MPASAVTLEWIAVASLDDLWVGEMINVQVGDEHILLVRLTSDDIRAYQGQCPHQRSLLADGELDGHTLTCTAHMWQFNLCTGKGVNPQGCHLNCHQSKIQDSTIFVGIVRDSNGESPWKERSSQNS